MALILALNPGNSHSPTLSRLARELHGCELIGAESCGVAISAIKKRVPDVVLLPAKSARGEADLMAHLKTIRGGVLTLKLPPVESADPLDLARQIREMLTGVPIIATSEPTAFAAPSASAPVTLASSPHVIAAAQSVIKWIRTRQAAWADERPREPLHRPVAQWTGVPSAESDEPYARIGSTDGYQPYEPLALPEAGDDHASDDIEERGATYATHMKTWLPRAAALAAVAGIGGAVVLFWAQRSQPSSSPPVHVDAPRQAPEPATVTPSPAAIPAESRTEPEPDPSAKVSGWVAVFSPFDVQISEDGRPLRVDDRGRGMLTPGRHRLRFQNVELGYEETRAVEVRPTETTVINLTPQTTIAVRSNEAAEVWIDGTRAGNTPYGGSVGLGTHAVTVRTAGAERQLTVEATSKPVQLQVDFSKP